MPSLVITSVKSKKEKEKLLSRLGCFLEEWNLKRNEILLLLKIGQIYGYSFYMPYVLQNVSWLMKHRLRRLVRKYDDRELVKELNRCVKEGKLPPLYNPIVGRVEYPYYFTDSDMKSIVNALRTCLETFLMKKYDLHSPDTYTKLGKPSSDNLFGTYFSGYLYVDYFLDMVWLFDKVLSSGDIVIPLSVDHDYVRPLGLLYYTLFSYRKFDDVYIAYRFYHSIFDKCIFYPEACEYDAMYKTFEKVLNYLSGIYDRIIQPAKVFYHLNNDSPLLEKLGHIEFYVPYALPHGVYVGYNIILNEKLFKMLRTIEIVVEHVSQSRNNVYIRVRGEPEIVLSRSRFRESLNSNPVPILIPLVPFDYGCNDVTIELKIVEDFTGKICGIFHNYVNALDRDVINRLKLWEVMSVSGRFVLDVDLRYVVPFSYPSNIVNRNILMHSYEHVDMFRMDVNDFVKYILVRWGEQYYDTVRTGIVLGRGEYKFGFFDSRLYIMVYNALLDALHVHGVKFKLDINTVEDGKLCTIRVFYEGCSRPMILVSYYSPSMSHSDLVAMFRRLLNNVDKVSEEEDNNRFLVL